MQWVIMTKTAKESACYYFTPSLLSDFILLLYDYIINHTIDEQPKFTGLFQILSASSNSH